MKNLIFLSIFIFFIGCSQKEITLTLPIKANKQTIICKNIHINSNNPTLKKIFEDKLNKIIFSKNGLDCKIYIENHLKNKIINYTKKVKIIYDKKHPKCIYYKQTCILKGIYYFCSNRVKISKKEFQKINHFHYKFENYYINNPKSNLAYKIFKKCKNNYLILRCKKGYFKINNHYFLNKKEIFNQKDLLTFDTCKNINDKIYFNNKKYIIQKIQNENKKIKNKLINEYNFEINEFIKNFFPHMEIINIQLVDPESKDKKIEEIFDKLVKKKKITYSDLSYIKKYLKGVNKKNIKEYLAIEIMKYSLILKLNKHLQKNQLIKELKKLLNISKTNNLNDYFKILLKIKKIIEKLY